MLFNVKPVPKPRMTRNDKWRKRPCVVAYHDFKDTVRLQANLAGYVLPDSFKVTFGVPFPRSYKQNKRDALVGQPCKLVHRTGDVDNYVKAIMDTIREEDNGVWHVDMKKIWAYGEGFVEIEEI
jgi:Holliday junction resolvase RusA-like endonuclease